MTTASPLATRAAWLPVSVIVPLAEPEHRADNTRTTAAALPAEAMRRVTAAGLLKCGRLTFHCRRQLMPFRGSAGVCAGCASAVLLASTPLKCPAALVPATGARRAWTGIAKIGAAAAAPPAAMAAVVTATTRALAPAVRVLNTVHLLTLAVPRSYPLVSEMNPATPRRALL